MSNLPSLPPESTPGYPNAVVTQSCRVPSRTPAPVAPPPVSLSNSSAGCPGTRFADQAGTELCLELKVYATSTPPPPGCYSAFKPNIYFLFVV